MAITRKQMIADVVQAMEDSVAFLPEDRREAVKEKLWGSLSARMFNMGMRDETETTLSTRDADFRTIESKLKEKNCG